MRNVVVVGSQWGDEGKGKIVDWLSDQADIVVRFQGGHNAGHTLVVDGITYKLRLLPSGIVRKDKISIIGNGVVVDPWALLEEIDEIKSKGIQLNEDNFILSESANLILPFHKEMDEIREDEAGKSKIGTTRRGIGPAYEDKVGRRSIRVMDLRSESNLDHRLETVLLHHNAIRKGLGKKIYKKDKLKKDLLEIAPKILKFSKPVWLKIDEYKRKKKKILFEGAQGILLDVDHGTYPFVTSSNTVASSAATGTGCGVDTINYVLGITKAYTTRVGEGPFPTELHNDVGEKIQKVGHEFGATTGRKRRCGWLDLPLLKYTIESSKLTSLALTKLDILTEVDELKVCTSYNYKGEVIKSAHPGINLYQVEPVYENMEPFKDKFENGEDLSPQLKKFIKTIEDFVGVPVGILAFGPERNQIQFLKEYF